MKTASKTVLTYLVVILALLSIASGVMPISDAQTPAAIGENGKAIASSEQTTSVPPEGLNAEEWRSMQELIREAEYQVYSQTAKLTASDAEDYDQFGITTAISGDTVVVGARQESGAGYYRGAAYIFTRNETGADNWGQVKKLTASDTEDYDQFGISVAISGDTVVVGAHMEDGADANIGAAYIFERNQGGADSWGQVAKLTASDGVGDDQFGNSVAISGDTVVVAASRVDGAGSYRGAVYIFERNENGADNWGEVKKLTASDAEDGDYFGRSVAISGNTVVVGANLEEGAGDARGAAYIFMRNEGGKNNWGQVKKLTASDAADQDHFGISVAINGETVAVGAYLEDGAGSDRGAAYIFTRNQGGEDNWGQVKKLTASDAEDGDRFGRSVTISGDTVVVGAYLEDGADINIGATYIFMRNEDGADNWGQAAKLTASDGVDSDQFGYSVAISGNAIVAGAYLEDGAGSSRGAAYLFTANNGQWHELATPYASDTADNDAFGISAAISGDAIVVGAYREDGAGSDRGAAYIFTRNEDGADNWGQVAKLTASDAADQDYFGYSVAISGDTAVVGAFRANGAGSSRGAAYLFERNQGGADNWGQTARLIASDAEDVDFFGRAVAISGNIVVVGAHLKDGEGSDRGAAYIFKRSQGWGGSWGEMKKLTASDAADYDYFGASVAISGDTIVVGADGKDGMGSNRGAAYIFERNQDGVDNWGKVTKLTASDTADDDHFGVSAAISGDTIVVGAYKKDDAGTDRGTAYIFERNQGGADNWGQVVKLTAPDAADEDYFGEAVSISGDTAVIGANLKDGAGTDRGTVYIFERNQDGMDNWGQIANLTASDAADNDFFGQSVFICGNTVVVGADGKDGVGSDHGGAYIYRWAAAPEITVSPDSLTFGEQDMDAGPTLSQTVTITNSGTADLHISSVNLTGADAAEFVIENDSGETTLSPNGARIIQISFDPSSEGAKSATLSIASNDSDEATVNVLLSGNGVLLVYVYLPQVLRNN